MKHIRRIFSLIIICYSLSLVNSCARNDLSKGLRIVDNAVTGYFNEADYVTLLRIPDFIVEIEDEAFLNCKNIGTVYIPASVIKIGKRAFKGSSVTRVYFEKGSIIETINYDMFESCPNLKIINLPDHLVKFFYKEDINFQSKLEKVTINENNQYMKSIDGNIYSKDEMQLLRYATGKKDKTFVIPDGVHIIMSYAFSNANYLEKIILSKSVKIIDYRAFYSCRNLKEIIFDDGNKLTSIGPEAFANCSRLDNLNLPNTLTEIGSSAFENNVSLQSILIPKSVTRLESSIFKNCTKLKSITFDEGFQIDYIGQDFCYNCESLTSITIPKNVTEIWDRAFYGCNRLKEVLFEEYSNLSDIHYYAFYNCSLLTDFEFPLKVSHIEKKAFYGSGLTSINLGEALSIIEESAFENCVNLSEVNIARNSSLKIINRLSFFNCPITSITLPDGIETIDNYAFNKEVYTLIDQS